MAVNISKQIVLNAGEGLRLQSGPGRDLIFKVTGEDTNGAFDYFIVEEHQGHHDWLVLVAENAPYARFVSDLAGYDLKRYDGNVESLIQRVVAWLMTQPAALSGLRPTPVIEKLEAFRKAKARLKAEWNEIPWTKLVQAAFEQAPKF